MEITLEKIELVKDRTGVTYKEAKEALEKTSGNVVDAIILIEEMVNDDQGKTMGGRKDALLEKMKEIVKKGNVSRIVVIKDDVTLVNIPLNVGILGGIVAPLGMIAALVASFGFKCLIKFIKDDGTTVDISEKAGNFYEDAVDKGTGVYEEIKEKAPGVYEEIKDKSSKTFENLKDKFKDRKKDEDYDDDEDIVEDVEYKVEVEDNEEEIL